MITDDQYIDHEIRIRVLCETTMTEFKLMQKNSDDRFLAQQLMSNEKFTAMEKRIDERFKHVDYKFNIIIGMATAILITLLSLILKSITGGFV
jgi:uncharacterized iron-regulated protein